MSIRVVFSFILCVCFACSIAAQTPGPREPLSFRNVGLYGGWNEYFASKDSPFDFVIVHAVVVDGKIYGEGQAADGTRRTWNDWLKIARANGKRVIADLGASVTVDGVEHSFQGSWNEEKPIAVEQYFPMFDKFFEQVDEDQIYAFTISEENVFWNGQQERLVAAYDYLKKKYNVPLWQWWSPSHAGSIVGMSWPNLPSDGWALDEYHLQQPAMESSMRMYTVMRKPAFQIIWAAPEYPGWPWSEKTFWDQFTVCRKYNIPIAFFCWSGRSNQPYADRWAWQADASPGMRKAFEDYCVHAATLAKRLAPVPMSEWDFVPWAQPRVQLQPDETGAKAIYDDPFVKPRQIASWSDAIFTGFANLAWDSTPLQFKPRSVGEAESTLRYCFEVPEKAKQISIRIEGKASSGATLEALAFGYQDKVLAQSRLDNGAITLDIDAAALMGRQFSLLVRMKGNAASSGETLAEISRVNVTCELSK
jgi:hypothetical protein